MCFKQQGSTHPYNNFFTESHKTNLHNKTSATKSYNSEHTRKFPGPCYACRSASPLKLRGCQDVGRSDPNRGGMGSPGGWGWAQVGPCGMGMGQHRYVTYQYGSTYQYDSMGPKCQKWFSFAVALKMPGSQLCVVVLGEYFEGWLTAKGHRMNNSHFQDSPNSVQRI